MGTIKTDVKTEYFAISLQSTPNAANHFPVIIWRKEVCVREFESWFWRLILKNQNYF